MTLHHRIGSLALDVSFALTAPWTVLFAPSGAGKSTILRLIAGIARPDRGHVVSVSEAGERAVLTDAGAGVFVPPHLRRIRLVGQQAALFPHRTVRQNVLFGMGGREALLDRLLVLCRIDHLAGKMPGAISGGERQRVALARALGAGAGRAMLLDEPFSALDVTLRDDLTGDLRLWLREQGTPVLHVTHDVGEVFGLDAEVIRLDRGRVAAQGSAADVMAFERERLLERLGGKSQG